MFVRSLYALKDIKTGFSDPITQPNDAVAVRSFERSALDLSQQFGIPLCDLQLWRIGEMDLDSGTLISSTPELLVEGATLFRKDVTSVEKSECEDTEDL